MCSRGHVNVFQWNWERAFLRHAELNSRFDVMTIKCNFLRSTKNRYRASPSSVFSSVGWDSVRTSSKSLRIELFTSYKLFPPSKWIFGIHDLFQTTFTVQSAIGNYEVFTQWALLTSLASSLRAWISDASKFSSSSNVCDQRVSPFPIPPAYNAYPKEYCWQNILTFLVEP